ncbi:MAG: LytR C-terminal domain-containing protein [Microcella sp.]
MPEFPPDRFDDLPSGAGRVGAHRAPRSRATTWRLIGFSAATSIVLVVVGLVALAVIDDRLELDIPVLTAPPDDEPQTPAEPGAENVEPITNAADANLPDDFTITILDGTGSVGRGPQAQSALDERGWPVGTVTQAAATDIEETVVYYTSAELEPVARGMVELLDNVADIELTDAFPGAPITIVLGSDYELRAAS